TLRTGESLTIACVIAPDDTREAQIRPFLAHKPPHYREHIEAAFRGQCDSLETRFYLGLLDGEMVGTMMKVETGGVGIFGQGHPRSVLSAEPDAEPVGHWAAGRVVLLFSPCLSRAFRDTGGGAGSGDGRCGRPGDLCSRWALAPHSAAGSVRPSGPGGRGAGR